METTIEKSNSKVEPILNSHNIDFDDYFVSVTQFPKEFQRNWLLEIDRLFILILLATCFFHLGVFYVLNVLVDKKSNDIHTQTLQEKYAQLLLNKFVENEFTFPNTKENETYLYGVPDEPEISETSQFADYSNGQRDLSLAAGGKEGQSVFLNENNEYITIDDVTAGREVLTSNTTGSSESKKGGGILDYITNDHSNAFEGEIDAIFSQLDESAENYANSMSNIKLNKQKQLYSGSKIRRIKQSDIFKGSKSTLTAYEKSSSLTPLDKVSFETVVKNVELESMPASYLVKKDKKGYTRNPAHITKIVTAHNPAIQDCYKMALKNDSELRGKIIVRITIDPGGDVTDVQIIQSTIQNDRMMNCILNRIRHWRDFGECDESFGTVSFRQTYVFGE